MIKQRSRNREGLTLVELLVVITILLIVAGVVLPMAQPALKQRAVREAAQQLQMILSSAQQRAIATQQPVGVRLQLRNTGDLDHTNDIGFSIATVGFTRSMSSAALGPPNSRVPLATTYGGASLAKSDWDAMKALYESERRNGNIGLVQIGSNPTLYRLPNKPFDGSNVPGGPVSAFFYAPGTPPVPPNDPGVPESWIMRFGPADGNCLDASPMGDHLRPNVTRGTVIRFYFEPIPPRYSLANSSELPVGTYLDMSWSGVGLQGKFFDNGADHMTVMFRPDGGVAWLSGRVDSPFPNNRYLLSGNPAATSGVNSFQDVRQDRSGPYRPDAPIHFLVARQKRSSTVEPFVNMRPNSGSIWVSINHQTGAITTSENLGSVVTVSSDPADVVQLVADARSSINVALEAGG